MQPVYGHRSRMLDLFHSGVPMQHRDTVENRGDHVLNISLREAMRTDGERTEAAINLELTQLMVMNVFAPVHAHRLPVDQRSRVIRSIMFLKQKLHPDGTPDKTCCGWRSTGQRIYNDLSSPTVSTSAVLTVLSIAAHEHRLATVVGIGGAYLNADMDTGVLVHMRLDATVSSLLVKLNQSYGRYMNDRGCIVVLLKKALYGCVEFQILFGNSVDLERGILTPFEEILPTPNFTYENIE
jgi:hypothetical protein